VTHMDQGGPNKTEVNRIGRNARLLWLDRGLATINATLKFLDMVVIALCLV